MVAKYVIKATEYLFFLNEFKTFLCENLYQLYHYANVVSFVLNVLNIISDNK